MDLYDVKRIDIDVSYGELGAAIGRAGAKDKADALMSLVQELSGWPAEDLYKHADNVARRITRRERVILARLIGVCLGYDEGR